VVKTAEELYPARDYVAIEETMSTERKDVMKEKLCALGNTVGFAWLLQKEVEEIDLVNFPIIEDIMTSVEFTEATDKMAFFQKKCFISDDNIKHIASLTTGQVSNEKWFIMRKFRITASNFGAILAACKRNRFPESLFKTLIGKFCKLVFILLCHGSLLCCYCLNSNLVFLITYYLVITLAYNSIIVYFMPVQALHVPWGHKDIK